jgi:UPF0716 family protein affecting phage T7 exclusion
MRKLILPFLLLPPLDLFLIIQLRHAIGGWLVLLTVAISGLLGAGIARAVGMRQLRDWRNAWAQGRAPARSVVDGLLLLLGCAWLILPGPLSDVLGLALLIGPIRRPIGARVSEYVRRAIERGALQVAAQQVRAAAPRDWAPPGENVIDVQAEVVQPPSAADEQARKRLPS